MLWALPVWTLLVWATRIRIVLSQDGSHTAVIVPLVLTVLALGALVERRRWLAVLSVTTIVVWAARLPLVLVHSHSAGFKIVHAVLAIVSIWLAVAAAQALRRRHPLTPTPASPTRRSSAPS